MDDATLIQLLEIAAQNPALRDRDRRRIAELLPALHASTLKSVERQDLEEIASEFARPPAANAAIGNTAGRDVTQKNQSGGVDASGANITQMRDIVGRDKYETTIYHGDAPRSLAVLRAEYLSNLCSTVSRVPLPDADTADTQQREVLLDDIYTRLEVASTRHDPAAPDRVSECQDRTEPSRQFTVFEAIQRQQRVVLLGSPGSGKSTVVNSLVWALAQGLQRKVAGTDFLIREGWTAPLFIPILVNLSHWSQWITATDPQLPPMRLFWEFLEHQYDQLLVDDLMQQTNAGHTLVLFDGLDELPADHAGPLVRLKNSIYALAETSVAHIVVTCRVLDYARPKRQLLHWPRETLLPFSDTLQQVFIARWYATLDRLGRALLDTPEVLRPRLQAAVRSRTDLRRIAGNPLLLTMMALLHASQGELPDKRVELYSNCVDLLLRRWRRYREGTKMRPSLEEYLRQHDEAQQDVHDWGREDTEALLDRLAFVAHSQVQAGADGGAGTNLTEEVLMRETAAIFRRYEFGKHFARAEAFCSYISENDNGILQRHDATIFRFPHRTFQEFLAARYLISDRGWAGEERDLVNRLLVRCDRPEWREVLQLAVSKLVSDGSNVRVVATLIDKLLRRNRAGSVAWARNVTTAAELLVEVPRQTLKALGPAEDKLWDGVLQSLWRVLDLQGGDWTRALINRLQGEKHRAILDAPGRVRAGTALGYLMAPVLRTTIAPEWCDVPAGMYPLGEYAQGQTVLLESFRIARYPVTNALYRHFIMAGGYTTQRWWSDPGWSECQAKGWTEPEYWDDARFNGDLQPVVGVSWYESMALCAWLSDHLGYSIMLPSEAQWEASARGPEGLVYPWGNTWEDGRANVEEQFAGTTPVVCFASGASWCGALDMSGNVWEWTGSDYWNVDQRNVIDIVKNSTKVSMRGGAWNFHRRDANDTHDIHCFWYDPNYRFNNLGVRFVTSLTK